MLLCKLHVASVLSLAFSFTFSSFMEIAYPLVSYGRLCSIEFALTTSGGQITTTAWIRMSWENTGKGRSDFQAISVAQFHARLWYPVATYTAVLNLMHLTRPRWTRQHTLALLNSEPHGSRIVGGGKQRSPDDSRGFPPQKEKCPSGSIISAATV
jgi:hypothetical protein